MIYRKLGRTDLEISVIGLGTMTWGTQTPEADAHAQIDMALESGVNFMDTAEMYPVNPVAVETIGRTEEVIGNWFARTGRRQIALGQGQDFRSAGLLNNNCLAHGCLRLFLRCVCA